MIHSLKFWNIGSFADEAYIDLTWTKKDSLDDTIAQDLLSGINVSKILTIVGPNASGKSNLLRVLAFMRFWIVDAWRSEVDKRVDHQDVFYRIVPFLDNLEKESKIECIFETKTSQYRIQLVLQGGFASEETIAIRSKSDKRTTWKTLFSRENIGEQEVGYLRKNASIVFTKSRFNDEVSNDIINYWTSVFTKVPPMATINNQHFEFNRGNAMWVYKNDVGARNFVNQLLERFNTGFLRLDFEDISNPDGTPGFKVTGRTRRKGKEYEMPFYSDGTLKLIDHAFMIYGALNNEHGVLLFDEIDTSFHPEVVDAILELFLSKQYNKKNSQIILTTHNPRILRSLYRYQIQLVEKNEEGESETYRLDDVEGVKANENYYARYMAGAYGAKQNIE